MVAVTSRAAFGHLSIIAFVIVLSPLPVGPAITAICFGLAVGIVMTIVLVLPDGDLRVDTTREVEHHRHYDEQRGTAQGKRLDACE